MVRREKRKIVNAGLEPALRFGGLGVEGRDAHTSFHPQNRRREEGNDCLDPSEDSEEKADNLADRE